MKRATATAAVFALVMATSSSWAAWILPPEAAPAITSLVDVQPRADRAGILRSASIDKDSVTVRAKRGEKVLMAVTLVHTSVAPEGAFRVGTTALVETPGPVDARSLAALLGRMKAAPAPIAWREIADPEAELDDEGLTLARDILKKARYLHSAADHAEARTILEALPEGLPPHLALRAGVLWQDLEAPKAAKAALSGLGQGRTPIDFAATAVLGGEVDAKGALADLDGDEACKFTELSRVLAQLGRGDEASAVADAVVERAPQCPEAWEAVLHRRLESADLASALPLADKALETFDADKVPSALLSTIGSAYLAANRHKDAAEILERAARRDPSDEGIVRVLLSAILRDGELRAKHTTRLEALHAREPDDVIAQFLLGIVYHYENRFEESTALLAPLEATLGHQSRLHIYLAMNDFNLSMPSTDSLGNVIYKGTGAAVARLDEAAKRLAPDPDIFYCRAEILRDTKRQQAREDLARYQAMSRGSHMSNPVKNARVQQMIADLDTCITTNVVVCKSLWEHPRHAVGAPPTTPSPEDTESKGAATLDTGVWVPMLAGGVAVLLGLLLWRRRRSGP